MSIIIIILIPTIVVLGAVIYLNQTFLKEARDISSRFKEIDEKIANLKTIEDCTSLMETLREINDNTDPLFKELKKEIRDRYQFVAGFKFSLNKLNED